MSTRNNFTTLIGEDLEVTVWFNQTNGRPQTHLEPEEHAEVEITEVFSQGIDIVSVLSDGLIDDLELECFTWVIDAQEDAENERADYLNDLAKDERGDV